jgi:hypothetical protein
LDALAVGIETFAATLDEELAAIAAGRGGFKAVRGEYGTGKTFFGRWLQERARVRGFAASEVQINETETPLHKLETVYRRLVERLGTADTPSGAFRGVVDGWFYALEQDVLADMSFDASDANELLARTNALMEGRLTAISKAAPAFSAVLRTYRRALADGDAMLADGLISWLAGQPNVAASVRPVSRATWITSVPRTSSSAFSPSCVTVGTPDLSWCSMKWKRSSACAPTPVRRD